jgi:hypothetical protein
VGVSFEVRQVNHEEVISLLGDDLVKYILRDTLQEDSVLFGANEVARATDGADRWLKGESEKNDS